VQANAPGLSGPSRIETRTGGIKIKTLTTGQIIDPAAPIERITATTMTITGITERITGITGTGIERITAITGTGIMTSATDTGEIITDATR
jgi:hypothetical protein